jgi:hypothetical protein
MLRARGNGGQTGRQAAATRENALADKADEQCHHEKAAHAAALVEMALAKEQCCHKEAEHATLSAVISLAIE